ncbi:hypothetical protein BHE74_00021792 [Ensete ventricosum]|nr:hypothetical protein BHE74_00021792 [Ensete ventricosum]RZR84178.1 hypothetical protein BHM03_00010944 [Ensete ventricosum]
MPPQDQTPVKEADLEPMSRNLKEGDRYVVHHGDGLTSVDLDDHVNLAEKEGAGMAGRGGLARGKRSSMDEAKGISCSISIALQKKTLTPPKEEIRSCRWTTKGCHRWRRGSKSRHRQERVHYECQSLEDVGCCQRRVGLIQLAMTRASTGDDHEVRWRSPTTSTASQCKRLSGKGAAAETKGKSRRPADLKGHIVEEGEAEVGGARGDAVGVFVMGLGNDCFKTGDATSGFTGVVGRRRGLRQEGSRREGSHRA